MASLAPPTRTLDWALQTISTAPWFISQAVFTVTLEDPAIDTYHNVLEAPCQVGAFDLALEGSAVLCPGESATLTAPGGFTSYAWNNGSEGDAIAVGETGNYTVLVYDSEGCVGISNPNRHRSVST